MRADWQICPNVRNVSSEKKRYFAASKSPDITGMPQLWNGWFIYDTRSFDRDTSCDLPPTLVLHIWSVTLPSVSLLVLSDIEFGFSFRRRARSTGSSQRRACVLWMR